MDRWRLHETKAHRLQTASDHGVQHQPAEQEQPGEDAALPHMLEAIELEPDMILMDIQLKGGVDGIEAAARIHVNDPQRTLRALEVFELTGKSMSSFLQQDINNDLAQWDRLEFNPRDWLTELFNKAQLDQAERRRVLRGTPPTGQFDAGRTVCSCFSVGINTLTRAIREQGLKTPEAIGERLRAGTNCGSCIPELRRLIVDGAT